MRSSRRYNSTLQRLSRRDISGSMGRTNHAQSPSRGEIIGEPTGNWLPVGVQSPVFNLGLGATGSADATRIDKINWFMAVADNRHRARCGEARPNGIFLLQSDLKLKEWLYDAVDWYKTQTISFNDDTPDGPFKQSVLSHEVKFEVDTSGSISTGWKLTEGTIGQNGSGLSAGRNRTNDLTITFGPATQTKVLAKNALGEPTYVTVYTPSELTQSSHLASEIGLAVGNNVKFTPQPSFLPLLPF